MPLEKGSTLGHYKLGERVGEGGMGVVWRAADSTLGRDAAIKVLPDAFSNDPERMARFEREARLLASLSHPNIAAVYGLASDGGVRFLAMEFVEGEDLSQRLAKGRMPLDEALDVARQIAAGVEAAHEAGVVHRDLKPGNVKVTPRGEVKVLDFGLAKGAVGGESSSSVDLSRSPTITRAVTGQGVVMGTAANMSPEQARGRAVDRRADIWAFGCVLFEMLTGRQAFEGETATDTMAAILRAEPEWSALPADTPPRLVDLMKRCLRKDPKTRLRDMGDVRVELEEIAAGGPAAAGSGAHAVAAGSVAVPRASRGPWIFAAAAALLAVALAAGLIRSGRRPSAPVIQFDVMVPATVVVQAGASPALSPDGRWVVFSAGDSSGTPHVYLRALGSRDVRALEGTEGGYYPFWSPDGRKIAFFAKGKLLRVALEGGPPTALAEAADARGGSWGSRDMILYAPAAAGPIYGVPAGGGTPAAVTHVDSSRGETSHRFPAFLPDGRHFLYCITLPGEDRNATWFGDVQGGKPHHVLDAGSAAVYCPPHSVLFRRQGALTTQRFDPGRGEVSGETRVLLDGLVSGNLGEPNLSVSSAGMLACQTGQAARTRLYWYDRGGHQVRPASDLLQGSGYSVTLSPDGSQALTIQRIGGGNPQIWVCDLGSGHASRLTYATSPEQGGLWSPDGRKIYYASLQSGRYDIYSRTLDGSEPEKLVYKNATLRLDMCGVTPDGSGLVLDLPSQKGTVGLWLVPTSGGGPARELLTGPFDITNGVVSPDGHWMAYTSAESGRPEVYVTSFPNPGARLRVSGDGGDGSAWTKGGRELTYAAPDGRAIAVPLTTEGGVHLGPQVTLFHWPKDLQGGDVSHDGERFLVLQPGENQTFPHLTIYAGWQNEEKR